MRAWALELAVVVSWIRHCEESKILEIVSASRVLIQVYERYVLVVSVSFCEVGVTRWRL